MARIKVSDLNVDPRSTAGILLREFNSIQDAIAYAERHARGLGPVSQDYAQAAEILRRVASKPKLV